MHMVGFMRNGFGLQIYTNVCVWMDMEEEERVAFLPFFPAFSFFLSLLPASLYVQIQRVPLCKTSLNYTVDVA